MKLPSISYAIMCCNEYEETMRLIEFLLENRNEQDEIVVLYDNKGDEQLWEYLIGYESEINLVHRARFNNNFSEWRNKLKTLCSNDYIFFIDADEIPHKNLIKNLPILIKDNPKIDAFYVPRINTVSGITDYDIKRWGWSISKLETLVDEKELDLSKPDDLEEYKLLKKYGLIIEEN